MSNVLANLIDGVAANIRRGSCAISLSRTDGRATFVVDDAAPARYKTVKLGLGTTNDADLMFLGEVQKVTRCYEENHKFWKVECIDQRFKFNRRQIWKTYASQSATAILGDILTNFTSGFTNSVAASLPSIAITFNGEYPTEAFDLVMKSISTPGEWFIDVDNHVYAYVTRSTTQPDDLDSSNADLVLSSFEYVEGDTKDVRNRVRVIGAGASVTSEVPSGIGTWPVSSVAGLGTSGKVLAPTLSASLFAYSSPQANGMGSAVHTGVAAGATSLDCETFPTLPSGALWANVGGQMVYATGVSRSTFDTLTGIPSSGIGSLQGPVTAGAGVTILPVLQSMGFTSGVPAGTAFNYAEEVNDATSQSTIATAEGGDGIHQYTVNEGGLFASADLTARGNAELAKFKNQLTSLTYETFDVKTKPRCVVHVNLDGLTDDCVIQQVDISEIDVNFDGTAVKAPRRRITAASTVYTLPHLIAAVSLSQGA